MAKKAKESKKEEKKAEAQPIPPEGMPFPELTEEQRKEIEKKMKEVSAKVEKFAKAAKEKFENYILGVSILPPEKKGQKEINTLVLVDDTDSQRMTKSELRDKLAAILTEIGKKDDIIPSVLLSTELWQACFDSNYEHLQTIAISQPVYDKGVLDAVRISEIHKQMVLKKFDKYIVSYVACGALFRGEGNEKSDIDVFIVIDDTDVKKMTRTELRDRLMSIIYQMAFEASALTGVKRQLHIQTYLLTDFWEILKDSASPVIFTFLRDGIPFFDRGIYMPWKHLLDMGRIRPSREAIRKFNTSGDHFFDAAKRKLLQIGVEDAYYAVLNPSQAALMMKGFNPPTHRETGRLMREVFVQKEKLLEPKYADILEEMIGLFKKWEYAEINELSGKEVDEIMKKCESYRKRIEKLFKQIESQADKESMLIIYDQAVAAAREALAIESDKEVKDATLMKMFQEKLVDTGKIPEAIFRKLEIVVNAKKDFDSNKITQSEIDTAERESRLFIRTMLEFVQRHRMREAERKTIRVKHKEGVAEIVVLDKGLFIITPDKIEKSAFKEDGSLGPIKASNKEEVDAAVSEGGKVVATLSSKAIENLKAHLGSDLELMV
ncbi:hypothetical protein KY325_00565 [Candidatus Woesearchaeota archaeon]|nr:hypothetical protein [Candidatus Woesearchaeota archaeon]MBW3017636.1 hypothetical protein [Candidatus Woesearchaeota archaeon]